MNLRKIDFEKEKYFTCGGREFEITDSLGFTRYKALQRMMVEWSYSATFQDIFNNLQKAIDAFNEHKYDKMVIVVHNVMNGITKIEEKDDLTWKICALFVNEKDEDLTVYNEAQMSSKIDCWGRELDVAPFFYLAASLVPGWMPAYELLIRDGSGKGNEMKS
jgi:hypothetical protein